MALKLQGNLLLREVALSCSDGSANNVQLRLELFGGAMNGAARLKDVKVKGSWCRKCVTSRRLRLQAQEIR